MRPLQHRIKSPIQWFCVSNRPRARTATTTTTTTITTVTFICREKFSFGRNLNLCFYDSQHFVHLIKSHAFKMALFIECKKKKKCDEEVKKLNIQTHCLWRADYNLKLQFTDAVDNCFVVNNLLDKKFSQFQKWAANRPNNMPRLWNWSI